MYELRDYQKKSVAASLNFFNSPVKKNSIILLPTGSGKSLVIAGVVKELFGSCLVLQPRREILEQNISKFYNFGGRATIYSASFNRKEISRVTFATIGSVIHEKHLFKDFDHVIIDECHLVNASGGMYEELLAYLNVKTLGLTATPYRLVVDGYGGAILKFLTRTRPKIFRDIIFCVQNKALFDAGYLSPIEYVDIEGFDISKVKLNTKGSDFDDESLKRYFQIVGHNDKIVKIVNDIKHKRNGVLVFNKFVEEARAVKERIDNAEIVTAKMKKKDRIKIIKDFRSGKVKVVCNVGVLTLGFDYPELDTIVLARPTMSLALYYQMIGRGIRPHSSKEKTVMVDLCGSYRKFGELRDLEFHENNGLYFISNGKTQLTNVYYGSEVPVIRGEKSVSKQLTMPFGKFTGVPISKIPLSYLEWLNGNVELYGKLQDEVRDRLAIEVPNLLTEKETRYEETIS